MDTVLHAKHMLLGTVDHNKLLSTTNPFYKSINTKYKIANSTPYIVIHIERLKSNTLVLDCKIIGD